MFIVLTGTVAICSAGGLGLLEQKAVITLGESGMLTVASRSATVLAKTKVTTLSLHKRRVEQLMKSDPQLSTLLYRNVMSMVRDKLVASNQRIAELLDNQQ